MPQQPIVDHSPRRPLSFWKPLWHNKKLGLKTRNPTSRAAFFFRNFTVKSGDRRWLVRVTGPKVGQKWAKSGPNLGLQAQRGSS